MPISRNSMIVFTLNPAPTSLIIIGISASFTSLASISFTPYQFLSPSGCTSSCRGFRCMANAFGSRSSMARRAKSMPPSSPCSISCAAPRLPISGISDARARKPDWLVFWFNDALCEPTPNASLWVFANSARTPLIASPRGEPPVMPLIIIGASSGMPRNRILASI